MEPFGSLFIPVQSHLPERKGKVKYTILSEAYNGLILISQDRKLVEKSFDRMSRLWRPDPEQFANCI